MDEDRRQSEDDGSGAQAVDNVVRLPCDWLGSRDELVPIAGTRPPPDAEPSMEMPPAAQDFWGEGSAAVQGALRAPDGREEGGLRQTDFATTPIRRRLHQPGRAAAAIGLVAGLALIIAIIGSGSSGRVIKSLARRVATVPVTLAAPRSKRSPAASAKGIARRADRLAPTVRKKPRARVHAAGPRHRRSPLRTNAGTQQTFVSSPAPAPASPAASQSTPISSQQTSTTSSGATNSGATSAPRGQTSSATGSGPPAGPSGPVALIGAGTSPSG